MSKKILAGLCLLALSAFAGGCSDNTGANGNSNANTSTVTTNTTTSTTSTATSNTTGEAPRTAPDNSEIVTTTDAGGVRTETRTFRNTNSRVERVVVTTRDGRRTARVYYRSGEVRELPETEVERALDATGDALVAAGGKVVDASKAVGREAADKAEDVAGEVGDKAEDVKDQTVKGAKAAGSGAKAVGSEVADKAEDVGDKATGAAKTAGRKTAEGAKKTGKAVKDALTP